MGNPVTVTEDKEVLRVWEEEYIEMMKRTGVNYF